MHPNPGLAIINFFLFLSLIACLGLYRYIYPKKNVNIKLALLLFTVLPLLSILRHGTYESGDLSLHAKIAMAFYQNLQDGIILPRWGGILCLSYGCPDFIFFYLLPYYLIALFHFLGFSFIASVKALLMLTFVTSGFSLYFFAKEHFSEKAAFTAAIFYLFFPYHLVDLHFRVDVAEMTSFALLPFVFLFAKKIIDTRQFRFVLFGALSLVLLILAHQAIALFSIPLLLIYCLLMINQQKKQRTGTFLLLVTSFVFGLLLSAFQWLPILFLAKYILWGNNPGVDFTPLTQLLYSPWRYGLLFQGPTGQLSFLIGYTQEIILVISFFLLIRQRKKISKLPVIIYFFIAAVFLFFMITPYSKVFWQIIPLIKNIQLSYRLLLFVGFFTSLLAAFVATAIPKKSFLYGIIFLTIVLTIANWGNRRVISVIGDDYLRNELLYGSPDAHDFTAPIWLKQNENLLGGPPPKNHIAVVNGNAIITQLTRSTNRHEYLIYASTPTTVRENTFYFPTWQLFANNKPYPFTYTAKKLTGIFVFSLPKGLYEIDLQFVSTPIQLFANGISILTVIVIFGYLIKLLLPKRNV